MQMRMVIKKDLEIERKKAIKKLKPMHFHLQMLRNLETETLILKRKEIVRQKLKDLVILKDFPRRKHLETLMQNHLH